MVNERKVRLMAQLASYESTDGKKDIAVGKYFRSDYMSMQMLKSLISGTLAFLIIVGVGICYHLETFMQEIYKIDLVEYVKQYIWQYAVFIGVYLVITYVVYAYRYYNARKNMKEYLMHLHRLENSYEE